MDSCRARDRRRSPTGQTLPGCSASPRPSDGDGPAPGSTGHGLRESSGSHLRSRLLTGCSALGAAEPINTQPQPPRGAQGQRDSGRVPIRPLPSSDPDFLPNSVTSGISLQLENKLVANILSCSEMGSKALHRCVSRSLPRSVRPRVLKCGTWKSAASSS